MEDFMDTTTKFEENIPSINIIEFNNTWLQIIEPEKENNDIIVNANNGNCKIASKVGYRKRIQTIKKSINKKRITRRITKCYQVKAGFNFGNKLLIGYFENNDRMKKHIKIKYKIFWKVLKMNNKI